MVENSPSSPLAHEENLSPSTLHGLWKHWITPSEYPGTAGWIWSAFCFQDECLLLTDTLLCTTQDCSASPSARTAPQITQTKPVYTITGWLRWKGPSKLSNSTHTHTPPGIGTPFTGPGCSQPCPTWLWTLPKMGHLTALFGKMLINQHSCAVKGGSPFSSSDLELGRVSEYGHMEYGLHQTQCDSPTCRHPLLVTLLLLSPGRRTTTSWDPCPTPTQTCSWSASLWWILPPTTMCRRSGCLSWRSACPTCLTSL